MPRIHIGLVVLLAISLALLPTSPSGPVMAQGGGLTKIALRGDSLPLPPAPPYRTEPVNTLYDFGPVDVNDAAEVVFFSQYLELSDGQNVCALLYSSGGAPGVVAASQDPCPAFSGQRFSFCPVLGLAPLTNDDPTGEIAFNSVLEPSGHMAIIVQSAGTFYPVVREGTTAPSGTWGPPELLDFNDSADVLFAAEMSAGCSAPPCEGIFVATGGPATYTITTVVVEDGTIPGDAGGGTVTAVGDASMNNQGDIVFKADVSGGTKGDHGIFLVSGATTTWVVGEGDEWKLGEAYSGGEEHKGRVRFVDTFATVGEPRINDADQVSYYATTDGGESGYFIAEPGSEYEQAKQGADNDPNVLRTDGTPCGGGRLDSLARHGMDGLGNIVTVDCGDDPLEAVIALPWADKLVIGGEVVPGGAGNVFKKDEDTFTLPVVSANLGQVGFKAETDSTSSGCPLCPGVFAGTIDLDDDDGDALLDKWEQSGGWDYNNDDTVDLNLWNLGARPNHKDIFVEVDYMDCDEAGGDCEVGDHHNHKPVSGVMEDGVLGQTCDDGIDNGGGDGADTADPDCAVVAAFDNAPVNNPDATTGIHLHVLVDEALPHSQYMNFSGGVFLEDPEKGGGSCWNKTDDGGDGSCDTGNCPQAGPPPGDPDCNLEDPGVGSYAANACGDSLDNGNDGYCDTAGCNMPADANCTEASDPEGTGTCDDGLDNDNNGQCDVGGCNMPADPDCTVEDFDDLKSDYFGTEDDRDDDNSKYIIRAKTRVFHYAIFGHSLHPDNVGPASPMREDTISGYAEMPGNDFIITLGEWTNGGNATQHEGTFMHELGHNLGLDHGGSDSMNWKPNYLSVMNYTFQTGSVVARGTWGVDDSGSFLDYSRWALIPQPVAPCANMVGQPPAQLVGGVNEGDLDEACGIDGNNVPVNPVGLAYWRTAYSYYDDSTDTCPFAVVSATGVIDWDRDGSNMETDVVAAIADPDAYSDPGPAPEDCECVPTATLVGHDDWSNLEYDGFSTSVDLVADNHKSPPFEAAQREWPDADSDSIADIADNCPATSNSGQEDTDGDQVGNVCDNCPLVYNPGQEDSGGSTKGDACDFPVGGIAELPDAPGSSALNYIALAGLAAAAVIALSAGAWYARRRWLG